MTDNLDPQAGGNPDPTPTPEPTPAPTPEPTPEPQPGIFSWQDRLTTDIKNSPSVQKFDNSLEGLNKLGESYSNLEKLVGHDKVPIPKGPDDVEGWGRFSKAMGIPDKAEGYGLADISMPDSMKEMSIDKARFAEVAHAHKLTPDQTNGLWKVYNEINIDSYNKAVSGNQAKMDETINRLKGEWGDAYDGNVELGQTVINKFSENQEMNDFLSASLIQDPLGVKFLAKLGNQFAENKIGGAEFQMRRFSLAPQEAQEEIDKINKDPKHPYKNPEASDREHMEAVNYVNSLYSIINRAKGQVT